MDIFLCAHIDFKELTEIRSYEKDLTGTHYGKIGIYCERCRNYWEEHDKRIREYSQYQDLRPYIKQFRKICRFVSCGTYHFDIRFCYKHLWMQYNIKNHTLNIYKRKPDDRGYFIEDLNIDLLIDMEAKFQSIYTLFCNPVVGEIRL